MRGREIIKLALTVVLVTTIVGYSCFVLYGYIRGPRVIIASPESGFSTSTPVVHIVGHLIHANSLTINDYEVHADLHGNFSSKLILADGYNIIKARAKDRYNRETEETIELTLLRNEAMDIQPVATSTESQFLY